jgi:hypothetical protein
LLRKKIVYWNKKKIQLKTIAAHAWNSVMANDVNVMEHWYKEQYSHLCAHTLNTARISHTTHTYNTYTTNTHTHNLIKADYQLVVLFRYIFFRRYSLDLLFASIWNWFLLKIFFSTKLVVTKPPLLLFHQKIFHHSNIYNSNWNLLARASRASSTHVHYNVDVRCIFIFVNIRIWWANLIKTLIMKSTRSTQWYKHTK